MRLALLCRTLACVIFTLMPCVCMADSDSSKAIENNDLLPIERLLETDFIPASRIANQVSDASSAVSIVTAQDIKDYGYRTLAEILNSMRGLNVIQDYQYQYLGGRGYGLPGEYAGRILLLIDGYRATDSYYGQAFMGNDGLLDVELIDRVEYIPGSGSSGYGNGAMLAAINVITKKGGSLNGTQISAGYGSHQAHQERITFGKTLENGADILFSASTYRSNGRDFSYPESTFLAAGKQKNANGEENVRLFFKGTYEDWTLESVWAKRLIDTPSAPSTGEYTAPLPSKDDNGFVQLKYDTELTPQLKFSSQAYFGQYDYHNKWDSLGTFTNTTSRWYGIDAKFVATWFDRHTLVFGTEYKNDYKLDDREGYFGVFSGDYFIDVFQNDRKTYSVYAYDDIVLNDKLNLNLGAHYEASNNGIRMLSPRAALIYKPWEQTKLKLSTGKSHRQATPFELPFFTDIIPKPERIRATELVLEQQLGWQTRLIGSLYQYKIDSRIIPSSDPDFIAPDITTNGAEIEFEKQWEGGTRLRTSYAKQFAKNSFDDRPINSPHDIIKINITTPLLGERLRVGLASRYIGSRRVNTPDYKFTGGYSVTDLTFTSANIAPGVNASLSIRNLFDLDYGDVTSPLFDERPLFSREGRNVWFQLEYNFK